MAALSGWSQTLAESGIQPAVAPMDGGVRALRFLLSRLASSASATSVWLPGGQYGFVGRARAVRLTASERGSAGRRGFAGCWCYPQFEPAPAGGFRLEGTALPLRCPRPRGIGGPDVRGQERARGSVVRARRDQAPPLLKFVVSARRVCWDTELPVIPREHFLRHFSFQRAGPGFVSR